MYFFEADTFEQAFRKFAELNNQDYLECEIKEFDNNGIMYWDIGDKYSDRCYFTTLENAIKLGAHHTSVGPV